MITQHFLINLDRLMGEMSQSKLSELSGIPRGRIANWITRKVIPSAEDIETLAKSFNVEPYYFFMEPGTQGKARPVERKDDFKNLLDELAEKCLNEVELESYRQMGANEFIRVLRVNYESDHILAVKWCSKLTAELSKYTSVNLMDKLKATMSEQDAKKNQIS